MSGGCTCHLISVKQNLKIIANVAVSKCVVLYCVVAIKFCVIILFHFISECV